MSLMKDRLPENINDYVVRLLKAERKRRGVSHETMANLSGLHRTTISVIEAKKSHATLLTLLKMARALEFSLGEALIQAEKRYELGRR